MSAPDHNYGQRLRTAIFKLDSLLWGFGLSPLKAVRAVRGMYFYLNDLRTFRRMLGSQAAWAFGPFLPMLEDRKAGAGSASGDYFHQDLLVARRIYSAMPVRHIDVGSRIDGFVAHVASFRKIEVVDIRPVADQVQNITFIQMDLMQPLKPEFHEICDSLSCLHALEHFGLGRYGDPIDPDGYKKGFKNLVQMLQPGGVFYFSVPIGRQRIEFNAHRIFGLSHLFDLFQEHGVDLLSFSYVDHEGALTENASLRVEKIRDYEQLHNGCGIFELRKSLKKPFDVRAG